MSNHRRRRRAPHAAFGAGGWSLVELSAAVAVVGLALTASLPALADLARRQRLDAATRLLGQALMAARWSALSSGRVTGLRLELQPDGDLSWTLARDGDGDGLRSGDLHDGTDPALDRPRRLSLEARGVRAGILPTGAVPRIPPQTGLLDRPDDPIKFGAADLVSFSPLGSATAGSLYLTDGQDMTALVLNGNTGRLRLLRFDPPAARWKEMP